MYACTVKFVFWPLGGTLAEHVYVDLVGFWVCPRKTSCFLQPCSHVTLDCFWNLHKFKCRLLRRPFLKIYVPFYETGAGSWGADISLAKMKMSCVKFNWRNRSEYLKGPFISVVVQETSEELLSCWGGEDIVKEDSIQNFNYSNNFNLNHSPYNPYWPLYIYIVLYIFLYWNKCLLCICFFFLSVWNRDVPKGVIPKGST